MTLFTKAQAFGRMLGKGGRRMRGLQAMFAKRGHLVQKGPPNYRRLGVDSKLAQAAEHDQVYMDSILNIAKHRSAERKLAEQFGNTKLPPVKLIEDEKAVLRNFEYIFNEGNRRHRVAKDLKEYRKQHGSKATRNMLQRTGMEFQKYGPARVPRGGYPRGTKQSKHSSYGFNI